MRKFRLHHHAPEGDHSEHHHEHEHAEHEGQAPSAIVAAMIVTIIFMLVEFVGGWIANSLSLISDASHMLIDVGALLLSLFAIWVARRPSTPTMSFGYHRAEILGALASGLVIWLIAGVLVYEAVIRISAPPEVQGKMVFIIATIGLVANLLSMRFLHSARHHNINVQAAYLHILSDSLGSVGAIIAGLVLWLTDWRLIDPIITIVFAFLMLASSWKLVKEAFSVLMESAPEGMDPEQVKRDLLNITGVQEVHDLHIWTVSTGRLALAVHMITRSKAEPILNSANELLKNRYGILHTTIQVEDPEHFRHEGCYDCTPQG
ncbi:MAG TPA: cation diffusion facilitator family transporter [Bdellovibrionota bacterium]|nr:cation diffusion facilitator family transporter [Bdellovibrionota bacterium]